MTEANAAAVAQICRRLDRIALALELAAARVRTLAVDRLAIELDQRFRILTGGTRGALPDSAPCWRPSTGAMSSSMRLIGPCCVVSPFVGGFSVDAAEAVCADDRLDAYDVLDVLGRLVDKSLAFLDDTTGRYGMLDTIRQFALDRATVAGELPDIRDRHLRWCLDLAGEANLDRRLPTWALADEIDVDYDNLLAAGSGRRHRRCAHLVVPARHRVGGQITTQRRRCRSDRVMNGLEECSPPWVRAVAVAARPRTIVGDLRFNIDVIDRALEAAERLDDGWSQTRLLSNSPFYRLLVRPDTDPVAEFDRAIASAAASGDDAGEFAGGRRGRPHGRHVRAPAPCPCLPIPP